MGPIMNGWRRKGKKNATTTKISQNDFSSFSFPSSLRLSQLSMKENIALRHGGRGGKREWKKKKKTKQQWRSFPYKTGAKDIAASVCGGFSLFFSWGK